MLNSIGWSLAWIVGCAIGLAAISQHPDGLESRYGWLLLALAVCTVVLLLAARGDRRATGACALLVFALAGCGRALLIHPPVTASDLAYYNGPASGATVTVIGRVTADPVYGDRWQRLRVSAEAVRSGGQIVPKPASGDMYTLLARYPLFDVGERLALSGTLTVPPTLPGFDYAAYLARQGVFSYMTYPQAKSLGPAGTTWFANSLTYGRSKVRAALEKAIPEPQAALAVGIVTGDRSSIPKDVQDEFQRSGTTHILAISGENISLIIGFVWLVYSRRGQKRRMPPWLLLLLLVALAIYTLFTGATPSVMRAAIMSTALLAAPVAGRRYDPTAALAISALFMTALDPNVLADAGFQLSFAAMLGITYLSPRLVHFFQRLRLPGVISFPLATSLGAQAATLPLLALLSGQVSLVSPLATLTADVSLLPLMVTGIATGILGAIAPVAGAALGPAVWLCAQWMLMWVHFWAAPAWAAVDLPAISAPGVALYYLLLAAAIFAAQAERRQQIRQWLPTKYAVGMACTAVALWLCLLVLLFKS